MICKKSKLRVQGSLHIIFVGLALYPCSRQDEGNLPENTGQSGQFGTSRPSDLGGMAGTAGIPRAGTARLGNPAIQVSTGYSHTCALLTTGKVRCWGWNKYGQLGYRNAANREDNEVTPTSAREVNLGDKAIQITTGTYHTCALLATGKIRCWGWNHYGQLGYGNTTNIGNNISPTLARNVDVGEKAIQVTANGYHSCAVLTTGKVSCWGWNYFGQLGYGHSNTIGDDEPPASAGYVNVGGNVIQLTAGTYHTCALLDTGKVRCWGSNHHGQLGYRNTTTVGNHEAPATAGDVKLAGNVIKIKAEADRTCALLDSGKVRCWGEGEHGRIGYGAITDIENNEIPPFLANVSVAK
jgi:alpha-tubulin suppressor-like RCC1 family protein